MRGAGGNVGGGRGLAHSETLKVATAAHAPLVLSVAPRTLKKSSCGGDDAR